MSLINDALKRARKAQPPPPDSAGPPMTPVTYPRPAQWPILIVPLLLIGMVVVATWLFWYAAKIGRNSLAEPLVTRASARERAASLPPAPPLPYASALARTEELLQQLSNRPVAEFPSPTTPLPGGAVATPNTNTPNIAAAPPVTSAPAVVEPPKPPPLRLQAIFYRTDNPSAVINRRTLYLGDKIGDSRVIDIGQECVKLLCQGQTNVLTLTLE
jgi:hypothetical protein